MKRKKHALRAMHKLPVYLVMGIHVLITAIPLYYVIINAFKGAKDIARNPMVLDFSRLTMKSVERAWQQLSFPQTFLNTLILLVLSVSIMVIIGSLGGYAIVVIDDKVLKAFYTFAILVITIPFQVVMVPMVLTLNAIGLSGTYIGTSLAFVALSMPLVIFLYTGFMRGLPKELSEAAFMDGSGFVRTYLSIYMPLMKTVTGTVLILRGTYVWNDLLVPLITLRKGSMQPLVLRLKTFASVRLTSWDLIFGGTFLVTIPILILYLCMQRVFIRGIITGAVKG